LVAGGDDLQERKKLLVKDAEALVVLPGGPGTWDEVRHDQV
jgi:predicted Rossmann-fold nucleotide-binding protein